PNFPNPFTESTTFRYSLPQTMQVRLAVYDMLGREVQVLVEQQQDAGIYTINFEAGTLPSGIYLARIELDHLRFTKRMVLAR
ncbi:MAG: T9SS type A sorting domain-containing protein, partial [Rhodothermales bacterium]